MSIMKRGLGGSSPFGFNRGSGLGVNMTAGGGGGFVPPPPTGGPSGMPRRILPITRGRSGYDMTKYLSHNNPRTNGTLNVTDAINSGHTVMPWVPNSGVGPGTDGYRGSGVVGSAAGALGSKGMPTSQRGRFEKFGSEAAANMTTADAMDVAQNSDALGGIGFGGLREIFNRINPTPGMPSVPAPAPVAATQALPEIPKSLAITQPPITNLHKALPTMLPSPAGSVNSTTNPVTLDPDQFDPNDPNKRLRKSSLFGSAPGMVANPILSSIFASLNR